jgi:hypothetical protein
MITADLETTDTSIVKDSTFTVTGNINSQDSGIVANSDSVVSVEGNITALESGVELRENASVTVKGNIKAVYYGVSVAGVSSLAEITGNVESDYIGIYGYDGTVKVDSNVYAGADGVFAMNGCKVTILGAVFATEDGVEAKNGAVVVVEEGITTTNTTTPDNFSGVKASDGASVTVNGPIMTSGVGVYADSNTDPVTVTVHASINAGATGVSACSYGDSVDIVVNGDITARAYGVYAYSDEIPVSVTVKGNISTEGYGIYAFTSDGNGVVTVSLTGSIIASNYSVYALEEGTLVDITGNITADTTGLFARKSSVVKLTGDITARFAVSADTAVQITIQGNIVYGRSGLEVRGEGTLVTMTGNITDSAEQFDMAFMAGAIYAGFFAKVVLNGNITTHDNKSTGVQTYINATVIVNGNIQTSGESAVGVYAALGFDGFAGDSDVIINGNITSTDAIGVGVFSAYGSKVTVNGTITAPRYVVLLDTTVPSGWSEINRSITSNDATSSVNGYLQYSGGDPLSWVWVRVADEVEPPVVVQPKPPVVVPSTGDAGVLAGLTVSFLVLAAAFCLLKRQAKLLR